MLDEEDGQQLFFNEVEFEFDKGIVEEPDIETVVRSYRRKKKGKRNILFLMTNWRNCSRTDTDTFLMKFTGSWKCILQPMRLSNII